MDYFEFLDKVINEGITSATLDYTEESEKEKLDGSVAGFNACRKKTPEELILVWQEANNKANESFLDEMNNYWYYNCFKLEVEWVCNVVSALLINEGHKPLFSWLPTANGCNKAAKIVGINTIENA